MKKIVSIVLIGALFAPHFGFADLNLISPQGDKSDYMNCIADLYEKDVYMYSDEIQQSTRVKIETHIGKFAKKISQKDYSTTKKISIYDALITKIDEKINTIESENIEIIDILEYIKSELISYKDMLNAEVICSENTDKEPVSDIDQKKAQEKILEMQQGFMNLLDDGITTFIGEIKKSLATEERGNMEMSLEVDTTDTNIEAGISFKDYVATQNMFDSQLTTTLSAFMKINGEGEDGQLHVDISSFIDYIMKDGNLYLLLDELNISTENVEHLETQIVMLEKFAAQNKYITIPADQSYNEALTFLSGFNPDAILGDIRVLFSKPLFMVDEKIGDKYILVPTKFACDNAKKLTKRFDPIYGSESCSMGQYKKLVRDFNSDEFQMYMMIDSKSVTHIGINAEDDKTKTDIDMLFNREELMQFNLSSHEKDEEDNLVIITYTYKKNFDIHIQDDTIDFKWISTLNNDNSFKSGNLDLHFEEYTTIFIGDLSVDNGKIEGGFELLENNIRQFTIESIGSYDTQYLDMKNTFFIAENPYAPYDEVPEEVIGNLNFNIDMTESKNNINILLDIFLGTKKVFNFNMIHTGIREHKDIDIQAPSNTVPLSDILENSENEEHEYLY